jgi:hypothetical protein
LKNLKKPMEGIEKDLGNPWAFFIPGQALQVKKS